MLVFLVDVAQNLAAYVLSAGSGIGHDALRRGEDGDTQTVLYAGHVGHRYVLAQTGTADALKILDGVGLGGCVPLQSDLDGRVTLLVVVELVSQNVTLLEENLRDCLLNLRAGSFNHFVVGFHRVSNSREKIRNRIRHNELKVKIKK